MSEAIFLVLLSIITGGGGFFGRWVFKRLDALQVQVDLLLQKNSDLAVENAVLEREKKDLEGQVHRLEKRVEDLEGQLGLSKKRPDHSYTSKTKRFEE